jgi:uncharacterized protein (TIGR02466 family)
MPVSRHFPTLLYSEFLRGGDSLRKQLLLETEDILGLDVAGHDWSAKHYPNGFTSYASANELHRFSPTFHKLERLIDVHVAKYAKALDLDLGRGKLKMTTCWVNFMQANTHHGLHIHPLSVVSGTYYVSVPKGSGAIKFEDPRLPFLMHAPPKKIQARQENRLYVQIPARPGTLVLFESWLRHEVPLHQGKEPRISISFNYDWE